MVRANQPAYFGRPITLCYYWPSSWRLHADPIAAAAPPDEAGPSMPAPAAAPAASPLRYRSDVFRQPPWLPFLGHEDAPYMAHIQLALLSFNYLLRAIRRRTPPLRKEGGGDWIPRQIYGSTSEVANWGRAPSGARQPGAGDIIHISDDEDVRVWLAASAKASMLFALVIFHDPDPTGEQTPPPMFKNYLSPEVYEEAEDEDDNADEDDGA